MSRLALSLILLTLPALAQAEAPDRYGPDRDGLRGSAPVMSRGALLTWSSKQRAEQGQKQPQPQPSAILRGAAPPATPQPWAAQASATPQPEYLPDRRLTAAELTPGSIREEPPAQTVAPRAAPRQAPIGQPYAPQGAALKPRRYSVGREFGVEPDPIVIPDPSILAYAPEVGAAVIAQQERDRANNDPGPASPADLDMLEQRQQDAERAEARQKAQADSRAKKAK